MGARRRCLCAAAAALAALAVPAAASAFDPLLETKNFAKTGERMGSRCERNADRRLLTDRWRDDARGGAVDLNGDSNLYSFYRRSRYDLSTASGREASCDDMRRGCRSMRPDRLAGRYDLVADAHAPPGRGTRAGGR